MQNNQPSDKLSIGEASKYLGISIDTLRRWEKRGRVVPFRSPGGHRYYTTEELDKLFNKKYTRDEYSDKKIEEKIVTTTIPESQTPLTEEKQPSENIAPSQDMNTQKDTSEVTTSIPPTTVTQFNETPPEPITPQPAPPEVLEQPVSQVQVASEEKKPNDESILNPPVLAQQPIIINQNQEERLNEILYRTNKNAKTNNSEKILIIGVVLFTILDVALFIIWYSSTKIVVPIP